MEQIKSYIDEIGMNNLLIIGGSIIALLVIFIIYRHLNKKSMLKKANAVENKLAAARSLPLQYRLGRVQTLSKSDPLLLPEYERLSAKFSELQSKQKDVITLLMNDIDEQLYFGKMRKVKPLINEANEIITAYENDCISLLTDIEKITEVENVRRVEIIKIKERFRNAVNDYNNISAKVDEFVPQVKIILDQTQDEFLQLEECMNKQEFEEANRICLRIVSITEKIEHDIALLPSIVGLANVLFPKQYNDLIERIKFLENQGYILSKLDLEDSISAIDSSFNLIVEQVKALRLDGRDAELEELLNKVTEVSELIDVEEGAQTEYRENWNLVFSGIENVNREFNNLFARYELENMRYVIPSDINIQDMYDEFKILYNESQELAEQIELDSHSYVYIIDKCKSLVERNNAFEERIRNIYETFDGMHLQEERAIKELENINIIIVEIKSEIKNSHLPMINASYKDYIKSCYDEAANISNMINSKPIELSLLTIKVDETRDLIFKLYENVHNLIVTAQMVEEAIVFGNRYRSVFIEVNTELTKAEVLYRNGEYTKGLSTVLDIIDKIAPGEYEKIIQTKAV